MDLAATRLKTMRVEALEAFFCDASGSSRNWLGWSGAERPGVSAEVLCKGKASSKSSDTSTLACTPNTPG